MTFRIVEQVGDVAFVVRTDYPSEAAAMLAAVDMIAFSDEERDLFVDGPGLSCPVGVGRRHSKTHPGSKEHRCHH